jgi:hypothetical protein
MQIMNTNNLRTNSGGKEFVLGTLNRHEKEMIHEAFERMRATETDSFPLGSVPQDDGFVDVHGVNKFHPPVDGHLDPSFEFRAGIAQQRAGGSVDAHGHSISPFGRHTF